MNSNRFFITCDDLVTDLNHSSYKEEMMKQSDLFYIIYFWIHMENHPSMDLMYDDKFRELHLRYPVMRNLAYKYLGLDRTMYLYPNR